MDPINHFSRNTASLGGRGQTWDEMKKAVRILGPYRQEMGQQSYLVMDVCCPLRKGKNNSPGDSEALRAAAANMGPEGEGPES